MPSTNSMVRSVRDVPAPPRRVAYVCVTDRTDGRVALVATDGAGTVDMAGGMCYTCL